MTEPAVLTGLRRFDHIGMLVRDTGRTMAALRLIFPMVKRDRREHLAQDVYVTYLATQDGSVVVELVEPMQENAGLIGWLNRENKACIPYHICIEVDDFDLAYREMKRQGWVPLTKPFETLDGGHLASHLFRPEAGIVEITGAAKISSPVHVRNGTTLRR